MRLDRHRATCAVNRLQLPQVWRHRVRRQHVPQPRTETHKRLYRQLLATQPGKRGEDVAHRRSGREVKFQVLVAAIPLEKHGFLRSRHQQFPRLHLWRRS